MDYFDACEQFIIHCLAEKGLQKQTIINYNDDLKSFYKFLNEDNFQVGYDSEEITTFSREIVENIPKNFCSDTCVNWKVCGELREVEVCDNCDEEKKD